MGKGKENMSGRSQIFSGGGSKMGLNQKLSSAFYGERDMSYPGGMPGGANKSYHGPDKGQGYDSREDESLSAKDGKESGKSQSFKDRRDEREGENKAQGNKPDGFSKYPKINKLKGDQVKLDKNNNGKIDGADFKMMKK